MPSRSPVRTNAIIFSILGLVVALLIHFIVLSSPRYNWLELGPPPEAMLENLNLALMTVATFI